MHKRIIWSLFLAAFILDFFRSRSSSEEQNSIPKNRKENFSQNDINDLSHKPKKKTNQKNYEEKSEQDDDYDENEKILKKQKNSNKYINLRIEFCQSWSHRGYFNQVKEHLEKSYSNISVIPSDYPLSTTRKFLNYLVLFFQFGSIGAIFCLNYIKDNLKGIIPEKYFDWIEGNKLMIGMGAFFIGNILNNNITNAGAFEIYCNERLVWSAINNEKRVPNIETIIKLIQRYGGKLKVY